MPRKRADWKKGKKSLRGIRGKSLIIFASDIKGKAKFHETEDWILEENSDWIFSFENICEVLGFNPSYVRQGLMRWKEMKLAERSKSKNGRG